MERYPMLSLTRQYLKDIGIEEQYIHLLTNDEMQKIARRAAELLMTSGVFAFAVSTVTWNLLQETGLLAALNHEEEE